jgi:hypothetical protein
MGCPARVSVLHAQGLESPTDSRSVVSLGYVPTYGAERRLVQYAVYVLVNCAVDPGLTAVSQLGTTSIHPPRGSIPAPLVCPTGQRLFSVRR